MEKTIKIGSKEFKMSSSAYTQFKYKNDTGRSLMADLVGCQDKYKLLLDENNITNEQSLEFMNELDDLMNMVLRIAYIMTNEADKNQAQTFEDFLKQTDNYFGDLTWLNEVVELATSPFSRGIQAN